MFGGSHRDSEDDVYYYTTQQAAKRYGYQSPSSSFDRRETERGIAAQAQEKAGEVVQQAKESVSDLADQTSDLVGQASEAVSGLGTRVQGQAEDLAHHTRQRAEVLNEQTRYYTRRAKWGFVQMMEENPLAVGAMALAVGAAVGLSVPTTRKEDEWLGETRDRLLEEAQTKVQETVEKVKHVATEAGQAAKDTAQQEAEKQDLPTPR